MSKIARTRFFDTGPEGSSIALRLKIHFKLRYFKVSYYIWSRTSDIFFILLCCIINRYKRVSVTKL